MTTQRLRSILDITGGPTPAFQAAVSRGSESIGGMSMRLRDMQRNASRLQQTLDSGQLGAADIRVARNAIRDMENATEDLRVEYGVLQRQLDRGDLGARDAANARREMARLEQEIAQGEQAAREFNEELQEGRIGTRTREALTREQSRLNGEIDEGTRSMRRMTREGGGLNRILGGIRQHAVLAGAAIAAGIGAGAVAGLVQSLRTFAEFEQSMAQVRAVSGATTEQFDELTAVAREMGRTTTFTANEAAQALSFMAMAGLSAQQSIEALPDVLNLAAAGMLDLATAADIVTNVMAGYGLAANEVTFATDVLTTGFISANTDLTQLGEAFKLAGPVAKGAGLEFTETAAALSIMGNAGFQGTLAGTALRGAITRLLTPTAEAQQAMARLGVSVTDSQGAILPLTHIVAEFEAAIERAGDSSLVTGDIMQIFGQRAGPAMQALIGQGVGALEALQHEMDNAGGVAETVRDTQLDTLTGDFTKLASAVTDVQIALGSQLSPELRDTVQELVPMVQGIGEWIEENPKLTGQLALFAGDTLRSVASSLETIVTHGSDVLEVFVAIRGASSATRHFIEQEFRGLARAFFDLGGNIINGVAIATGALESLLEFWNEIPDAIRPGPRVDISGFTATIEGSRDALRAQVAEIDRERNRQDLRRIIDQSAIGSPDRGDAFATSDVDPLAAIAGIPGTPTVEERNQPNRRTPAVPSITYDELNAANINDFQALVESRRALDAQQAVLNEQRAAVEERATTLAERNNEVNVEQNITINQVSREATPEDIERAIDNSNRRLAEAIP